MGSQQNKQKRMIGRPALKAAHEAALSAQSEQNATISSTSPAAPAESTPSSPPVPNGTPPTNLRPRRNTRSESQHRDGQAAVSSTVEHIPTSKKPRTRKKQGTSTATSLKISHHSTTAPNSAGVDRDVDLHAVTVVMKGVIEEEGASSADDEGEEELDIDASEGDDESEDHEVAPLRRPAARPKVAKPQPRTKVARASQIEHLPLTSVQFKIPTGPNSFTFEDFDLETALWPSIKSDLVRQMPFHQVDVTLGYQISTADAKTTSKEWGQITSEKEWGLMVEGIQNSVMAESRKAGGGKKVVVKICNLAESTAPGKGSGGKKKPVAASRAYKRSSLPDANDNGNDADGNLDRAPSLSQVQQIDIKIAEIHAKHKCKRRECNSGPCWDFSEEDHHKFTRAEVTHWAKEIVNNNATVEKPPQDSRIHMTDAPRPIRTRATTRTDIWPNSSSIDPHSHPASSYQYLPPIHPYPMPYPFGPYHRAGATFSLSGFDTLPLASAHASTQTFVDDAKLDFPLISVWLADIDTTSRNRDSKNYSGYIPVFENLKILRMNELLNMSSRDLADMSHGQLPFGIANDLVHFAKEDAQVIREQGGNEARFQA
ncbi:hypothetical protein BOTBODRAFT_44198 [Botryobasidium botryosum FD-172 SS1]|uniref:Uncharacterized protein n=1 Tax=Botryobasidium botryosum (strain FD-172 SS1) TaxID=930990 RepID=A0A067MTT6_BOTB1|nr:hypothetical protein BOTBODRAFT_44198 [Botryobasidium botryosum FD-172 SS1]